MENFAFLIPVFLVLGLVLVGVWLLSSSVKQFSLKRKHLPHMERVEGTVVDVKKKAQRTTTENGRTTTTYANFPVIQFTRASGETVTFTSEVGDVTIRRRRRVTPGSGVTVQVGKTGTTETEFQRGEKLPVLYDPDGALEPMIDGVSNIWMPEISMTMGGVAFLAGAIIIAVIYGPRLLAALGLMK